MKLITLAVLVSVLAACTTPNGSPRALTGEDLYARNCAACHGPAAEGNGPVAAVMTLSVPNLRALAERNNGVFPRDSVREYIDGRRSPQAHGDRYMPVWGEEFRAMQNSDGRAGDTRNEQAGDVRVDRAANARIEALTDFIASIQYSAGR